MNVEFEEFDSVEDIFLYMASITAPMKNVLPINSYKGYICSIIPLGHSWGNFPNGLHKRLVRKWNLRI